MTEIAHGIWAAGVASVAFAGHRVAITWLNQRERANVAATERAERESGVNAKCEAMERELASMKSRIEVFIANNGGRR